MYSWTGSCGHCLWRQVLSQSEMTAQSVVFLQAVLDVVKRASQHLWLNSSKVIWKSAKHWQSLTPEFVVYRHVFSQIHGPAADVETAC